MALGAVVREYFNAKNAGKKGRALAWQWPLAVGLAAALIALTAWKPGGEAAVEGSVSTADAFAIVQVRCVACHSKTPTSDMVDKAPGGMMFDEPAQLKTHAAKVLAQTVLTDAMPLGNVTEMTLEERARLGQWIKAGMPDD